MTSVPTLCEMTTYILVTQPVYADIHPGLMTIPLDMLKDSLPHDVLLLKLQSVQHGSVPELQ